MSLITAAAAVIMQIWGLREPPVPRLVLPLRANVCSLEYCPSAAHMLAVGSAGHQVRILEEELSQQALHARVSAAGTAPALLTCWL
jgi:hypothetical protein